MSTNKAFGESRYGPNDRNNNSNSSTRTVSIWPPAVPHNCLSLLVLLLTRKHIAVEAFAAGELSRRTIPRAKPVVTGSTEPVNTVVTGGAATKIANNDNKMNGDGGTSLGVGSDKAARNNDTTMRNKPVNNSTSRQVPSHGGDNPQPAKQSKTVRFSLC